MKPNCRRCASNMKPNCRCCATSMKRKCRRNCKNCESNWQRCSSKRQCLLCHQDHQSKHQMQSVTPAPPAAATTLQSDSSDSLDSKSDSLLHSQHDVQLDLQSSKAVKLLCPAFPNSKCIPKQSPQTTCLERPERPDDGQQEQAQCH